MSFLPKLPKLFTSDDERDDNELERELLSMESAIGGRLFGPVAKGHRREFFCLDQHTWVWHEEWLEKGKHRAITTRYEIRPGGVLKVQDGQAYQRLSEPEARNLYWAIEMYRQQVGREYQRRLSPA